MTLLSGNTFGARLWTDGKQEAPMLPRPPAVVQCGACDKAYWLEDADKLEAADQWSSDVDGSGSASVSDVEEPTAAQYYKAIADGLGDNPERERYIRILAMWRENDAARHAPDQGVRQPSPSAIDNLTALVELLSDSEEVESQVMMAEVLRELGRFDDSISVLSLVTDDDYSWVVGTLLALCDQQVSAVKELTPGT